MQTPKEKSALRQGLVISYFGKSVAVEAEEGQVFTCQLRRNQELPVVGDKVEWQLDNGDTGIIVNILPRRSLLTRGEGQGKKKPVAANLDAILIVMAPSPIFSEYLIDRYLVAAELLSIQPILVLNKIDLLNEDQLQKEKDRLLPYRHIPYPVILSSIFIQNGLQELAHILENKTGVLVGPSGVGKSSIIAGLANIESIKIGNVSDKGVGKHTTTATRLYHLSQHGNLIDSPGVREFNLWKVSEAEIQKSFKEFKKVTDYCKFRDCSHTAEPHCAVKAAVERGDISEKRYASYQELMKKSKQS